MVQCSSQQQVRYCVDGRHELASEKTQVCGSVQSRKRRSIEAVDDFEPVRSFFEEDLEFAAQVGSLN